VEAKLAAVPKGRKSRKQRSALEAEKKSLKAQLKQIRDSSGNTLRLSNVELDIRRTTRYEKQDDIVQPHSSTPPTPSSPISNLVDEVPLRETPEDEVSWREAPADAIDIEMSHSLQFREDDTTDDALVELSDTGHSHPASPSAPAPPTCFSAPEVSQRPSPPSIISQKRKNPPASATQPRSKRPRRAPKAGPTEAPTLPLCQPHGADQIVPVKDAVVQPPKMASIGTRTHKAPPREPVILGPLSKKQRK
jgi:hypothetical protein